MLLRRDVRPVPLVDRNHVPLVYNKFAFAQLKKEHDEPCAMAYRAFQRGEDNPLNYRKTEAIIDPKARIKRDPLLSAEPVLNPYEEFNRHPMTNVCDPNKVCPNSLKDYPDVKTGDYYWFENDHRPQGIRIRYVQKERAKLPDDFIRNDILTPEAHRKKGYNPLKKQFKNGKEDQHEEVVKAQKKRGRIPKKK